MNLSKSLSSLQPVTLFHREINRTRLFLQQPPEKRAALLHAPPPRVKKKLLRHVPLQDLVNILEMVELDEATNNCVC